MCGRASEDPKGDESKEWVRTGNLVAARTGLEHCPRCPNKNLAVHTKSALLQNTLAPSMRRTALLLLLATARGVFWAVEQPMTSLFWEHPRWQCLLRQLSGKVRR